MKYTLYIVAFFTAFISLFGCYPNESDVIEIIDTEMPIDTVFLEEGISTFILENQEISKEGNGFICNFFDDISGETIRRTYISTGEYLNNSILFNISINDIVIIQEGIDTDYSIFIWSDVEGEAFEYRCTYGSAEVVYTTATDSELKGTWTGNFEKSIDGYEWENYGVISGSFQVMVMEIECE